MRLGQNGYLQMRLEIWVTYILHSLIVAYGRHQNQLQARIIAGNNFKYCHDHFTV